MLFVREDSVWIALGHVIPIDGPAWNQPIHPRWEESSTGAIEKFDAA
jgi:hypothetical protein